MAILTYVMTPIFKNYILKFRAWLGFSMKNVLRQAPKSVFMILSATAVKLHLTRKSAVSLQWRSKSWKVAWEPVEIGVWRCFWFNWRISVSKMGSSVQNYWKKHRNIQNREKISKNRVKKNWAFFDRKKVVIFRFPWVRTASLGFPGVKQRRKNEFYIQKIEFSGTRDAGCQVLDAGTRDAGCRVPGVLLPRGDGFSVLRIF